jgi:hypothetical protein
MEVMEVAAEVVQMENQAKHLVVVVVVEKARTAAEMAEMVYYMDLPTYSLSTTSTVSPICATNLANISVTVK